MYYYVIYDMKDNIVGYFSNLDELSAFTQLRKRELKYKLKFRNFIYFRDNSSYKKIYKFYIEEGLL